MFVRKLINELVDFMRWLTQLVDSNGQLISADFPLGVPRLAHVKQP